MAEQGIEDEGWVKNFRKIKHWEWYTVPNMAHLFQHLVREANSFDDRWRGVEIKRGQLVTGLFSLSTDTGLSVQSIRTCLARLKSTGEITIETTNQYSLITIVNYDNYNFNPNETNKPKADPPTKRLTNEQQTTNNKQEEKEDLRRERRKKKRTSDPVRVLLKQVPFKPPFDKLSTRKEIVRWLRYKQEEKRFTYKPRGYREFLNQWRPCVSELKGAVRASMSKGYSGCFISNNGANHESNKPKKTIEFGKSELADLFDNS